MSRMMNLPAYAALKTALTISQFMPYRRLMDRARDPDEAQAKCLARILSANADTTFGRSHGFASIKDAAAYREAVPVQDYEDLRPLIERQERTGETCLTMEQPVYHHRTSGTVGQPKNIPVTASGLGRVRAQQRIAAYRQASGTGILRGKVFAVTGPAVEGYMEGGTPFGSASGLLYRSQSRFIRSRYVLPTSLFEIEDYDMRYLAMAAFGLAEPTVTCLATANPSTFTRLLSVINANIDMLLESVASGRIPADFSDGVGVSEVGRSNPKRARDLARTFESQGRLLYADIWPDLRGVITWTGGGCAVPLRNLVDQWPDAAMLIELGYLASEVRGTINVDPRMNSCLPTFDDTYFEFVEREAWESEQHRFLGLSELEVGQEYYVFITTSDGLYRYNMNDIVRATGRVRATPTLAFVQKGKGVTSITGEKVSEAQVLDTVTTALTDLDLCSEFFITLADQDAGMYVLYIEVEQRSDVGAVGQLSRAIDQKLGVANVEYASKRSSGRLAPLEVRRLRAGAGDEFRRQSVGAGRRDAQFKYLHLQNAHECLVDLEALRVDPE